MGMGRMGGMGGMMGGGKGRRSLIGMYGEWDGPHKVGTENGCTRRHQGKVLAVAEEVEEYEERGMVGTPGDVEARGILYAGLGLESARSQARQSNMDRRKNGKKEGECVYHTPRGKMDEDEAEGGGLEKGPGVCVVVRAYEPKKGQIPALLHSLFASSYKDLHVFLTEATLPGPLENERYLDQVVDEMGDCRVEVSPVLGGISFESSVFACLAENPRGFGSPVGYLRTEAEVARVLQLEDGGGDPVCEYVMVTNGDNLYGSAFFESIEPHIRNGIDFIHVGFTTHHAGHKARFDQLIDLGAVLLSRRVLEVGKPNFVVPSLITEPKGLFDADSRLFARLLADPSVSVAYIPRILFTHQ